MPQLRPQAIDSLWLCLCPSFDQSALRLTPRRPRISYWQASKHNALKKSRVSNQCRSIGTILPSLPKSSDLWKQKDKGVINELGAGYPSTPWSRRAKEQGEFKDGYKDNSQPLLDTTSTDIRTLPSDRVHAILQSEANRAYLPRVQAIVEILVRERGERPSRLHYHALISAQANLEHGSAAEVERLLQEMDRSGIELDAGICSAVLKALAIHPHYMLRCHVLKEFERSWISLSKMDHQHIIVGLLRDLQFELAWDRLNNLQAQGISPDQWLLNLVLYTFSSIQSWAEVHLLLKSILTNPEHRIPGALWSHLLHTATKEQYQPLITDVWNRAVRLGFINPSSGLCTMILESCAAHGDTILAADVFRVLSERSSPLEIWHYESLLEAYTISGDLEGMFSTVNIMTKAGFPLSNTTTRSLYTCLRQSPEMVADALGMMSSPSLNNNRHVPLALANVALEAMIQQGELSTALETFHSLQKLTREPADRETFNVLLQGCTVAARKDIAMSLAYEMRQRMIVPNALTYDRLILVCLSTKNKSDFEDAWRYYDELKSITPPEDTTEAQRWGLRRGTVKLLTESCVLYNDERAFGLLHECAREGMDVSILRRNLEKAWEEQWGQDSLLNLR